ncbi:hypothetical protein UPYG_G00195390 [Umbra pygmaea]|uniref:Uncharacterized protein n=1 Tax=Umbra pygmaea TaxID=75934 RepID=A0ABD0WMD8_UMBPY
MVCICRAAAARLVMPQRPSRPRAILHTGLATSRHEDASGDLVSVSFPVCSSLLPFSARRNGLSHKKQGLSPSFVTWNMMQRPTAPMGSWMGLLPYVSAPDQ